MNATIERNPINENQELFALSRMMRFGARKEILDYLYALKGAMRFHGKQLVTSNYVTMKLIDEDGNVDVINIDELRAAIDLVKGRHHHHSKKTEDQEEQQEMSNVDIINPAAAIA